MGEQWNKISARVKKRAAAVAALIAASAALCAGILLPAKNDDAPRAPETPPAIVQVAEEAPQAVLPDDPEETAQERKRRQRQALRKRAFSAVWAVVSFCMTAAVRILTFLLTALVTKLFGLPVATLAAFFGDVLVTFLAMLLLFSWVFHRLFPDKKLREFLTLKNLLLMLTGSVALSLLRLLLRRIGGVPGAALAILESLLTISLFAGTFLLLYRTGVSRGETAKKLTKKLLLSRPVKIAFAALVLTSILSACIRVYASVR